MGGAAARYRAGSEYRAVVAYAGLEFGHIVSASPWEAVIFPFPSRAAVRCGLGPRLSAMNLRQVLPGAYRGRGLSDATCRAFALQVNDRTARRRGSGLAGQTA